MTIDHIYKSPLCPVEYMTYHMLFKSCLDDANAQAKNDTLCRMRGANTEIIKASGMSMSPLPLTLPGHSMLKYMPAMLIGCSGMHTYNAS